MRNLIDTKLCVTKTGTQSNEYITEILSLFLPSFLIASSKNYHESWGSRVQFPDFSTLSQTV